MSCCCGGSVVVHCNPTVGICNYFMFCCALLCAHSSLANILMGKRERELVALLSLSGVY